VRDRRKQHRDDGGQRSRDETQEAHGPM
jgi:hypothetical protein